MKIAELQGTIKPLSPEQARVKAMQQGIVRQKEALARERERQQNSKHAQKMNKLHAQTMKWPMRSTEFVTGLHDFIVTVKLVFGSSKMTVKTRVVAQSHQQAQLIVRSHLAKIRCSASISCQARLGFACLYVWCSLGKKEVEEIQNVSRNTVVWL
jgi:hypothetical protein